MSHWIGNEGNFTGSRRSITNLLESNQTSRPPPSPPSSSSSSSSSSLLLIGKKTVDSEREMFFFFAGSLGQQVRQVLKTEAGRCIVCGSSKAVDLVEYDQVLKVLFVPIWRWPGKQPLLYCNNCSLFFPPPPPLDSSFSLPSSNQLRCNSCAHPVDPHFNFCPFCGSSL